MRAFVAVDIPGDARRVLADAVESLRGRGADGVRWVRPSAIHLTLKFLGDIDGSRVGQVMDALRRSAKANPPFRLGLSGLGAFPAPEKPRVLWAGLEGDLDALGRLHRDVDREVSPAAGVAGEKRPFTPHLTLGRVRDRASTGQRQGVAAALRGFRLVTAPSWTVTEVRLVRSTLTSGGPVYDVLGVSGLAG